jgi:hypothetical protein
MLPATTLFFALSILISAVGAIPRISVKGAKFFANGQQFFIKGRFHVTSTHITC